MSTVPTRAVLFLLGEVFGTGILGGIASYPIAKYLIAKETAVFFFVVPFFLCTIGGSLIAYMALKAMENSHILEKWNKINMEIMKKVLTIAGSDSGGGAGIQADLKTMTVHNKYGASVITAVTAQNTLGVQGVEAISDDFVARQLDSVFSDIEFEAVKTGMLANGDIVKIVLCGS